MHPLVDQLTETTAALLRALQAGDFTAAEEALNLRQTQVEALRVTISGRVLSADEMQQLTAALRPGDEALHLLAHHRTVARNRLASLEAERHLLAALVPKQPEGQASLNLSA
jgi:hypothetical protein